MLVNEIVIIYCEKMAEGVNIPVKPKHEVKKVSVLQTSPVFKQVYLSLYSPHIYIYIYIR